MLLTPTHTRRAFLKATGFSAAAVVGVGAYAAPKKKKQPVEFSDDAVKQAIRKNIEYLWSKQDPVTGAWPTFGQPGGNNYHPLGYTALAVYALLESGVKIQSEPKMGRALKALESLDIDGTYSLGLRANVWLSAARQNREKYLPLLRKDVKLLIESTADGSYGYKSRGDGKSRGDNSNSQYGLLGVWAGAQASLEIPKQYWIKVLVHWVNCQVHDGGWAYQGSNNTKPTMAAAGVASLFVCYDNLLSDASSFLNCRPTKEMAKAQLPIQRGLKWFDLNYAQTMGGPPNGYYLYGVERVGLASGYKYFGKLDWYKLGATQLLRAQQPNGAFGGGGPGGPLANASFGLLFLIRGRNAVLFNKLRFNGDWNNRPRDLASLTRWLNMNYEDTVNWQIINLSVPVREWHDAPILYISGARKPVFSKEDLDNLRKYVWQGGTIFSVAECNGRAFSAGMAQVYKTLFPDYSLKDCPPAHELYNSAFRLRGRPRFKVVSNGVRPLVVHTDDDLSREWQLQAFATRKQAFQAAANVYMCITDKFQGLRRRGTTLWPKTPEKFKPKAVIKIAKLKHKGNCDPEPMACKRFSLLMAHMYGMQVDVTGPMPIADLAKSPARLATLVGTESFTLSDAEIAALKTFIAGGGTLLMNAAGGDSGGPESRGFAKAAEALMKTMYGRRTSRLAGSAPVYNLPNMKIKTVKWRRYTKLKMGDDDKPSLRTIIINNRPAVFFTRLDIAAALLGNSVYKIYGYHQGKQGDPGSAFEIMRNIAVYAGKVK